MSGNLPSEVMKNSPDSIRKEKNLQRWISAGFFSILQNVAGLLLGLAGFMALIRVTSKETYGTWVLFSTISTLTELIRNGLLQSAIVKYTGPESGESRARFLTASMNLNFLLTAAGSVIIAGLALPLSRLWSSPDLQMLMYYYTIVSFTTVFYAQAVYLQQMAMDFKGLFIGKIVNQGSFVAGILLMVMLQIPITVFHLLGLMALGSITGFIVSFNRVRGMLYPLRSIEWQKIKILFHYGKYVVGTTISSVIFNNIDQMMLGAFFGAPAVATYNAAFRIANIVEIPLQSLTAIVFPESVRRIATEGLSSVRYLYEKSVGVILAMAVPTAVLVILFASPVITLFAGEKYHDTVPILNIVILFTVIKPFGRQFGMTMDAVGKPKLNFKITLFTMALNVVLNYFCLSTLGLIGAAYATLSTLIIGFFITQYFVRKELKGKLSRIFRYAAESYIQVPKLLISKFFPREKKTAAGENAE